ncbi:hypothetical protein Q7A53_09705 [Halobacillus rhizosphaerae]|uniref:hypothetical protein n=1 Tax=Halobacillus rhizosphaerae TaxID=3064889 RepID=UPI00398A724D
MKSIFFVLSLGINVFYLLNTLFVFHIRFSVGTKVAFGLFFLLSIGISVAVLFRTRKGSNRTSILFVAVLCLNIASLGWFAFLNYLSLLIG